MVRHRNVDQFHCTPEHQVYTHAFTARRKVERPESAGIPVIRRAYPSSNPKDYEAAMPMIKKGIEAAGEKEFDVGAYTATSIGPDSDAAKNAAKIVVAFIAAGSPPPVIERHGLPEGFNTQMGDFLAKGDFGGAIGAVTDEALDAFSVCGTPDEFIPKIEGLAEMGVTQYVAGSPVGKNVEESIKLLGDVIASF